MDSLKDHLRSFLTDQNPTFPEVTLIATSMEASRDKCLILTVDSPEDIVESGQTKDQCITQDALIQVIKKIQDKNNLEAEKTQLKTITREVLGKLKEKPGTAGGRLIQLIFTRIEDGEDAYIHEPALYWRFHVSAKYFRRLSL